jgi:hypothetical protein
METEIRQIGVEIVLALHASGDARSERKCDAFGGPALIVALSVERMMDAVSQV